MELIAESGLMGSLEVVEVNPILDRENETAKLAVELVASALGARISLVEEAVERLGGLVERVPVDRVAARDGDDLDQVAELPRGTRRAARRE